MTGDFLTMVAAGLASVGAFTSTLPLLMVIVAPPHRIEISDSPSISMVGAFARNAPPTVIASAPVDDSPALPPAAITYAPPTVSAAAPFTLVSQPAAPT